MLDISIVGKKDFGSGEFSGVFSEFVWNIFQNVEYFSGFSYQNEVRTFFRSH